MVPERRSLLSRRINKLQRAFLQSRGSELALRPAASNHPGARRATLPNLGGESKKNSPPQKRRGGAVGAGVVLNRKRRNSRERQSLSGGRGRSPRETGEKGVRRKRGQEPFL